MERGSLRNLHLAKCASEGIDKTTPGVGIGTDVTDVTNVNRHRCTNLIVPCPCFMTSGALPEHAPPRLAGDGVNFN